MACSVCLAALPEQARFCLQCGAAAQRASAEPADPLRDALRIALGRQYEIVRLLGRGGMGAVYLARETALERDVAIKVLPPDSGAIHEGRERFLREARTAARLFHPNIVPLYTFGEVDGTLFFVMGFVPGESLAARMRREGALPSEDTTRILLEISGALEYAHDLGIVHRDIKPDNVLIEEASGKAMLTDFGVAKALGSGQTMTVEGSLLGTPHYMSPEQAQGRSDIDHRSDIYSLGVMAFAMASGRLPFEGSTSDVLLKHITVESPDLKKVAPSVPSDLAETIARCLVKDPGGRWKDAQSLRAALSPADDDDVHPVLEGLHNFGVLILVSLLIVLNTAVWWLGGGEINGGLSFVFIFAFAFMLLVTPLLILEKARAARKAGISGERIRYEVFKQPRWWTGRYPRKYRARVDVWDRLPRELQRARNGMMLWIGGSVLLMVPSALLQEAFDAYQAREGHVPYPVSVNHAAVSIMLGTSVLLFVVTLVVVAKWERYARSRVADSNLRTHMMGTSTGRRAFWAKPEIAAMLAPAGRERVLPSGALSPRSMAQAISRELANWPSAPSDLIALVDGGARRAAEAVGALDREIGALSAAFDPAEIQRLRLNLDSFGTGDEYREARVMVEKQLELVASLEKRIVEMKARKSLHTAALQSMWDAVRSGSNGGSVERLTALAADLDAHSCEPAIAHTLRNQLSDMPTVSRHAATSQE